MPDDAMFQYSKGGRFAHLAEANRGPRERPAAPIRYSVVLGCGHRRRTRDLSNYPPTTAAVALCDECGRHVPVVVEANRV